MGDFNKRGGSSFGGGRSGGGFRGGDSRGSSFGGGRSGARPGNRDFRESQMFSATCAECQKSCEVPFRPTGDKPVYCSYCFSKHKEDGGDHPRRNDGREAPRREGGNNSFVSRGPSMDRAPRPQVDNGLVADLKKQIDMVNSKLDKVMEILKKADSQEVKKAPENKVDVKALSSVVKKVVSAPKAVVAKKAVKVVAKPAKKGKK